MGGALSAVRGVGAGASAVVEVKRVESASSDEAFDAPLSLRVHLCDVDDSLRDLEASWRVEYEVDVAHVEKRELVFRTAAGPICDSYEIVVPSTALNNLLCMYKKHELLNVSALHCALEQGERGEQSEEKQGKARTLAEFTAIVDVFSSSQSKTQLGALRRRVYVNFER